MGSPTDKARFRKFQQAVMVRRVGLLRVWRDDFEVMPFAEREKSIARSASRMDAAECGANARVFFDEVDAAIEIAAAEKDVIKHGRRTFFLRGKQRARTG